jgi:hypothetical protein
MRPLIPGLITFFGSGILWVYFSVIGGISEAISGDVSLMPLVQIFGILFFFSMPVTIIAEVIRWKRRRK